MRDRNLKKRTYARAKIPIYWIVNLVEGNIEVYTQPFEDIDQPNYAQKQDYRRSEVVPLVIEGIEIGKVAVDSLILK